MIVQVGMGGKNYGGRETGNYRVELSYRHFLVTEGDFIRFDKHPEFLEELRGILLGQVAPEDIKSASKQQVIVRKGETIATAAVSAIAHAWADVDLSSTPWAERINALKRRCTTAVLKEGFERGRHEVVI